MLLIKSIDNMHGQSNILTNTIYAQVINKNNNNKKKSHFKLDSTIKNVRSKTFGKFNIQFARDIDK